MSRSPALTVTPAADTADKWLADKVILEVPPVTLSVAFHVAVPKSLNSVKSALAVTTTPVGSVPEAACVRVSPTVNALPVWARWVNVLTVTTSLFVTQVPNPKSLTWVKPLVDVITTPAALPSSWLIIVPAVNADALGWVNTVWFNTLPTGKVVPPLIVNATLVPVIVSPLPNEPTTADTVAVAPETWPVIVSDVENWFSSATPVTCNDVLLVSLIAIPLAPETSPVISSPTIKPASAECVIELCVGWVTVLLLAAVPTNDGWVNVLPSVIIVIPLVVVGRFLYPAPALSILISSIAPVVAWTRETYPVAAVLTTPAVVSKKDVSVSLSTILAAAIVTRINWPAWIVKVSPVAIAGRVRTSGVASTISVAVYWIPPISTRQLL